MPLHLGVTGNHHGPPPTKSTQAAIREARKMLMERTREDWEYKPILISDNPVLGEQEDPNCDSYISPVVDWRERSYNTSSPSQSEADDRECGEPHEDFKFESPDSVGKTLEQKRSHRKRKRQAALEEERSWNEGFDFFASRRDAWTGARAELRDPTLPAYPTLPTPTSLESPSPLAPGASDNSSSISSGSEPEYHADKEKDRVSQSLFQPALVPVTTPILPSTHPVRSTINPSAYRQIYTEVVVHSRAPSVPINLSDMTKACVKGWIDDGEWPPKASALEPMIAKRRIRGESHHLGLRKGVEGVKKMLRLNSSGAAGDGVSVEG
ncbi:MAG: hypothetical protein M1820_007853 [Bogoriella megaspora]|nr:MAG: hypothetical protein M1820_007853 [Bogoriella megaspora]